MSIFTQQVITQIGYWILVLGIAIALGGGGLPPRGIKEYIKLLEEYRNAHKRGGSPTLDQKSAYYTYCCYRIGGYLILSGFVIQFLSPIFTK